MASTSGRAVFGVNALVSVVLVVLVAAVALVVNPPSPPGIAAFAPQASKPIVKAPPGQSSTSGNGAGVCAAGQVCTAPSATPKPTVSATAAATTSTATPPPVIAGVPSALQCVNWPDGSITQTFDPQSPPCVATWPEAAKGNGGSTGTGITGTEIRVAFPQDASHTTFPQLVKLADFFNTHYELYGRKIRVVPFSSAQAKTYQTGIINPDPSLQHADAVQAASLKVFAALDFVDGSPNGVTLPGYVDTLAQKKVIAIVGGETAPLMTVKALNKNGAYAWSYFPTIDQVLASSATMICRQLVGKPAVHSGDYKTTKRTWAFYLPDTSDTGGQLPGLSDLISKLATCGISNPKVVYYDPHDQAGTSLSASMSQFKATGITTLLSVPWYGAGSPGGPQHVADRVGYNPEWFAMAFQAWITGITESVPTTQLQHTFGVAAWNKLQPLEPSPWYQAFIQSGGDPSHKYAGAGAMYKELSMLAAGVQAAGPHLTAQTFAAGLHSLEFPNPGAATAPAYQATVGFASGNVMVNDFAAFTMDGSAGQADLTEDSNSFNAYQFFCYVDLGRRSTATGWGTQDRFYQGACR